MTPATVSAHDAMLHSLEAVAEAEVDIVPVFFARFFGAHPAERANFHNPASSQGAMVNEIMDTLLAIASGEEWVPLMLRNQVRTHHDHGDIALERYAQALDLFVTVLAEAAGPRWLPAHERAWREQAERMAALIERYY